MKRLTKLQKRIIIYTGIIVLALLGKYVYKLWNAPVKKETEHYIIYSTATNEQTEEIAKITEIVYKGYQEFLAQLDKKIVPHPKLKMKLYKSRDEFRRTNNIHGWFEAFYRYPYCHQYYDSGKKNPYHWAMHEASHQLNSEAAHMSLYQWLDEGIACYIGSSKIVDNHLHLGDADKNAYPIWWMKIIATSGDMETDKENHSFIPLEEIVSGHGSLDLNVHFNLYYLHWWSLVHFLMNCNDGQYRDDLSRLIPKLGTLHYFEEYIGKTEDVESKWYEYILELKQKYQ